MRVGGGGVAVEGRMGPGTLNQEELVEGPGSACSLGLRRGRPGNLVSLVLRRVGQRLGGTCRRMAHHPMARRSQSRAGTFHCISRGGHKGEGEARKKEDERGEQGQGFKVQPSTAPVVDEG